MQGMSECYEIYAAKGYIAEVGSKRHTSEEREANARLIAAAPELRDTVIELLKVAGACLRTLALTDEKFITVFDIELNREGVEDGFGVRARKVLAKSKGETYEPVMPVAPRAKATGGGQ